MNEFDFDSADAEKVSGRMAAPQKARRRRGLTLTPEVIDRICERLENGESLRQICQDPAMPAKSTIFLWLRKDKEFSIRYRCAKQVQINRMVDDVGKEFIAIADDCANDWVDRRDKDGRVRRVLNPDNIRQAKRRIAASKLRVGRLMPKKYLLW
jgi:hypothetical protein